jgi:hypothetical protein
VFDATDQPGPIGDHRSNVRHLRGVAPDEP